MKMQKDMVDSFLMTHRTFMDNLNQSFEIIEHDIQESAEFGSECNDEWCSALESSLDELAKYIYSISEPRWLPDEDSKRIHEMRQRLHDLYAQFKGMSSGATH
ncbi:hypothetical protein [Desulfogranum mediterraneum]|uniref:hypothetical protein n=1 Tax=Desulfogranum mediterraneum TaxID=160661 RepID=UPI00040B0F64|nr:hypothetical protein [Desulfogranum mediterraneum]